MAESACDEIYCFGEYVLDLTAGRLSRRGENLPLRPKVFDFLRLLVQGRGRLFSKDELFALLWPDEIPSDDSLTQLVSTLRSALGAEGSRIIVTVPKRGYRLGVPAELMNGSTEERDKSDVRYAQSGDVSIAYQIVGDGPLDLIYVPGWVSHIEYGWESPIVRRFYEGLADFSRLILFDKRGTGMSDRAFGLPTIEQRMEDVRAVMDAAGSKRAAILAMSEGCGMAIAFAAKHPERVRSLTLVGAFAKREWSPDYPWAPTPQERQVFYDEIEQDWGGPVGIDVIAPGLSGDPAFRAWWAMYQRRSASPAAALALAHMNTAVDVRDSLASVRAPTLVIHRVHDRDADIEEARYIANRIPNAKLCELPGEDHLIYAGDPDEVIDQTREFAKRF